MVEKSKWNSALITGWTTFDSNNLKQVLPVAVY